MRSKLAASLAAAAMFTAQAWAGEFDWGVGHFWPGNLVVSRSVYDNNADNVRVGTVLPPGCAATKAGCGASSGAPYNGLYPYVWNNDIYDSSFGITSAIYLDQLTPDGWLVNTLAVPNGTWSDPKDGYLVTSFSSKSQLALHRSLDGRYLTFVGYVAPLNQLDVSNSNTPAAIDDTNPVGQEFYRAVAKVDRHGRLQFTATNAYSGNNGRAAILNDRGDTGFFYTTGNAGNGSNPQPDNVILGAGAQILTPSSEALHRQNPGLPTPVASFSVTQLGEPADKIGKDDNFRGVAVFHNVLYYSKGSGGNGVNTIYFVDTTGSACPKGFGVPAPDAQLPTTPLPYNPADLQKTGLPSNMCILAGFPSVPNSKAATTAYPFGIWFANETTLYIADEGDGYTKADLYTHAAAQTTAGLQKWTFDSASSTWKLAYTLQNGLELGVPYTVRHYPAGNNPATGLPWSPATDGLRNLTGRVDSDGTVTIWAVTSTVSGNGDTGADPNRLVAIRDCLSNTDPSVAAGERFHTLRTARYAEVLRGVEFTPESKR